MAYPSVTYAPANGDASDITKINQNFTDLINALSDSSKDIAINALTAAGAATLNGHVTLGSGSADNLTSNGTYISHLTPTDATYDLGTSSARWRRVYLSSGWVGTITNDAAASGYVGEYITVSRTFAAKTAVTTATPLNVTSSSLDLTAGDWEVDAMVGLDFATAPAVTVAHVAISTTSATLPGSGYYLVPSSNQVQMTGISDQAVSNVHWTTVIPSFRVSIASSTSFYLVASYTFSGGTTVTVFGFARARRVR